MTETIDMWRVEDVYSGGGLIRYLSDDKLEPFHLTTNRYRTTAIRFEVGEHEPPRSCEWVDEGFQTPPMDEVLENNQTADEL